MRRRNVPKRTAGLLLAAGLVYFGLAYLIAPEFWSYRDHGLDLLPEEMRTTTVQGIPGDPINVGLVGSRADLLRAFGAAEWNAADTITWRSSLEIGESVLFDRPYADAPVSTLLFEGRRQDLAFEKPVGRSADQRHHVRFWLVTAESDGARPLWLGAASFDRGVGFSHDTGQITHHIGPDIDAERDFLIGELTRADMLVSSDSFEGIGPTRSGRNGEGDPYFTDGMVRIGILQRTTR
ncbi:MAG: LssY C-terminal domain-containing protein [Pseudaminobacter sp.]